MHSSAFAAAWKGCLPPLSHAAYIGDVPALVERLRQGDDVNEAVRLANQSGQDVTGVTPLYLAAQAGHLPACRALLAAGADVLSLCSLASGETFGPTDIALVCLHLRVWRLLPAAKRRRLSKLSALGRRGGVGGAPSPCSIEASLAEPLLQSAGARRSSSAFA